MEAQVPQAERVTDDLKAFERRLTEYVSTLGPQTRRWRVILVVSVTFTLVTAWAWMTDHNEHESFLQSLWNHRLFSISCCNIIVLFLLGIHRRVMAPQIVLRRTQSVLEDFNMSCDEKGRLILKPKPSSLADMYKK